MSLRGKVKYLTGLLGKEKRMLREGEVAPEFEAVDHMGKSLRLADFRGKNVVLWFFPKADTPG